MSKGLKELHHKRIETAKVDISAEGKHDIAYMPFYKTKQYSIIENELKDKEKQDNYIEMLEDRINNLETTYSRDKKALNILISIFDIKIVGDYLVARRGETCILYNLKIYQNPEITYLLKAVLDYE